MTPIPTTADRPAARDPDAIARETERLYRRQLVRRWALVAAVVLAFAGLFAVGMPVARHFRAAYYLDLSGYRVNWDIDEHNWDTFGSTRVTLQRRWSFADGPEAIDLSGLDDLINLVEVSFTDDLNLADEDLAPLARFPRLRVVSLSGLGRLRYQASGPIPFRRLTDACLAPLAKLPRLESLDLSGHAITDEGAKVIAGMKNLEDLRLDGTEVGDVGLGHLAGLPRLNSLSLAGTRVTPEALTRLQTARPRLQIIVEMDAEALDALNRQRNQKR